MREDQISILRCPDDGAAPLDLVAEEVAPDGELLTGRLGCPSCRRDFPIRSGIVSLLPRELAEQQETPPTGAEPGAGSADDMRREMEVRDEESGIYDQLYDDRAYRFELETYVARLDLKPGSRVLDVGCGTGRVTKEFGAAAGQLVCVDFSVESLRFLRARWAPETRAGLILLQAEVGHLPLIDATFDTVVSTSLFSNVPTRETREAGLAEIDRVLGQDGRFLISVYNHSLLKRLRQSVGLSRSGQKSGYHSEGRIPYYNFDPREFVEWISTRFEPGPCFGLLHRVPVLSRASPGLAGKLDRLLAHTPFSLGVFAKEMGMVASKRAR
jgi:SAM-dependent methyltransferase